MPHGPEPSDELVKAIADAIDADDRPMPATDPPQRPALSDAIARLRILLFPRANSQLPRGRAALENFVCNHARIVRAVLLQQFTAAYEMVGDSPSKATDAVVDLFGRLPAIRRTLAVDAQHAFDGDPAARSIDEVVICYPGFYALLVHRIAHPLYQFDVPLVPRMLNELAHSATGIDIHPGAVIGPGFFIDHGTGVTIGETTVIGDQCKVYQGVTLGAKSFERDVDGRIRKGYKRHPTLEDHVTVYAGATILGGDTVIGRGSVIAGGVFVTQSVPPNHIVAQPRPELRVREQRGL
ncbi:MAG: serine acetyltransferase [Phycisphaerae bacterium]|nr:serine acetyltransferase [Phycisphaerae bacterium]